MYNNTAIAQNPQPIHNAYIATVWLVKEASKTTGNRAMQNAKQMVA